MSKHVQVMHLISSLEVGGAEKLLVSMMEAAGSDEAIQYVVVVMNNAVNPVLRSQLSEAGCPVFYLNRPEGHWHFKYLAQLIKIIDRYEIQVIHVHNYGSKLWGVLCKLLQPSLKLVMTIHNTTTLPRLSKVHQWLHRHVIDLHIAISKTVERQCRESGLKRFVQIYNGIRLNDFMQATPDKPFGPFSSANRLKIVNVARMEHENKGQDVLIRALKICKDEGLSFHCKLVGGVYEYNARSYQYLMDLVKENNLENEIEFVINRTDIPAFLKEADLFILPSRFEGLGLSALEAMAAGLPVIVSDVDGPKELVQDYRNGYLFESENFYALAEAVKHVYYAPSEARRVAEEAVRFVQKFDISQMAAQYRQTYQTLVSEDLKKLNSKEFGRLQNEIPL